VLKVFNTIDDRDAMARTLPITITLLSLLFFVTRKIVRAMNILLLLPLLLFYFDRCCEERISLGFHIGSYFLYLLIKTLNPIRKANKSPSTHLNWFETLYTLNDDDDNHDDDCSDH
jgi:hypothetical protein